MKVISFIEQPFVIRRILKHLDLWEDPRPPPQPLEMVCEPCVGYVPWRDDVPGTPGNHKLSAKLVYGDRGCMVNFRKESEVDWDEWTALQESCGISENPLSYC